MLTDEQFIKLGWLFFILSAVCFLVVGIQTGDLMTTFGAIFFLVANIVFLVPVIRNSKKIF